jgi:hypothetical protein
MSDEVQKEIDQLLEDREKYVAWLRRLDTEKATTTERAFERVYADYQKRLDEVTQELSKHSAAVQGQLGELESSVAELEGKRAAWAEELDEAQLRRSVGEFGDDKEWAELESRLLGSMREVERQLDSTRSEIERLKEIATLAQGEEPQPAIAEPTPPPPPPPPPQPEPEPVLTEPEAPVEMELAAPEPAVLEPEPVAEGFDLSNDGEGFVSLEALVLEDKDTGDALVSEPPAEPAAEEPPAAESEAGGGGVTDELAFLESLSLGGGAAEAPKGDPESFSFLEQHGSGTPQTIICPHCSAANDPAEWYCTECGEELPAE